MSYSVDMEPVDIYNTILLGVFGVALAILGIAKLVGAWTESRRAKEAAKRRSQGASSSYTQVAGIRSHVPSTTTPSRSSSTTTDLTSGVLAAAAGSGHTTTTNDCSNSGSDSSSSGGGDGGC